jgi:hypothetical protein
MSETTTNEDVARAFHEAYERLAPSFGYATREASAKPWADVPEANRRLMVATVAEVRALLAAGTPQPTEEPKAQTVAELRAGLARYGMRLAVLPADTAPATTRTDPTNQRCPICAGTGWVREAKPGEYVEID